MVERPLDPRRRRALFRATHRGTKEMDWLLGRYADAMLAQMDDPALVRFEEFLAISDPDLNGWIINPETVSDRAFGALISEIRAFHGLDDLPTGSQVGSPA